MHAPQQTDSYCSILVLYSSLPMLKFQFEMTFLFSFVKAVTQLPQGEASVKNLWPDIYVMGWMMCQQRALLNQ